LTLKTSQPLQWHTPSTWNSDATWQAEIGDDAGLRTWHTALCCFTQFVPSTFIYLFKISDRRTRGLLILSEEHRNT